jgi:hypothetical protein
MYVVQEISASAENPVRFPERPRAEFSGLSSKILRIFCVHATLARSQPRIRRRRPHNHILHCDRAWPWLRAMVYGLRCDRRKRFDQ